MVWGVAVGVGVGSGVAGRAEGQGDETGAFWPLESAASCPSAWIFPSNRPPCPPAAPRALPPLIPPLFARRALGRVSTSDGFAVAQVTKSLSRLASLLVLRITASDCTPGPAWLEAGAAGGGRRARGGMRVVGQRDVVRVAFAPGPLEAWSVERGDEREPHRTARPTGPQRNNLSTTTSQPRTVHPASPRQTQGPRRGTPAPRCAWTPAPRGDGDGVVAAGSRQPAAGER